ncbi:hypothetical protein [Bifidobacterium bifidum]
MSDSKQRYSDSSRSYIGNDVPGSMVDQGRYDRSKDRETRWNESWKRQPVDLNDIVSRFTPGAQGRRRGRQVRVRKRPVENRRGHGGGLSAHIRQKNEEKRQAQRSAWKQQRNPLQNSQEKGNVIMELVLVLSLEGLNYYGYIPETFQAKPGQTESFELTEGDEDLLDKDFIGPIDRLCNSLIDPGDVDYLNAEQCKLMLGWLEWRLTEPINPRLETIYRKLVEFANKAIELGTGIVFDL